MTKEPRMISVISPYSITQELVTDCSFVSSLCIAAAYERRRNKQLVTKIIYPQNRKGQPVYNPCGKYMVKLWLNGIARKVRVRVSVCVCYNASGDT
jgi:calpain-7